MSIDYIGFIPLIVESLKQMQQTIQDQQKEIETLQSFLPAETKSMFLIHIQRRGERGRGSETL